MHPSGPGIVINRESEVPIRTQIVSQIELQIATRELCGGDLLPATAALARRLGVHKNTVSQAYSLLVSLGLLARRRGARVAVRSVEERPSLSGLDAILEEALRKACLLGYSP